MSQTLKKYYIIPFKNIKRTLDTVYNSKRGLEIENRTNNDIPSTNIPSNLNKTVIKYFMNLISIYHVIKINHSITTFLQNSFVLTCLST